MTSQDLRSVHSAEAAAASASASASERILGAPTPAESLARLYVRPGFLLRRAHQISASLFEDTCREVGLTPAQYGALTVLQARPGLDQASLARALGFDKVTVLRVLRVLEARKLLVRSTTPDNRRSLHLALTEPGRALLADAQPLAERAYQRLMAPLSQNQRQQLTDLLELMTQGLEPEARAPLVRTGVADAGEEDDDEAGDEG
ncbi:MarR family winged helix-turn-helix transcriptional regulator [Xylophilus ampelinus]|uniref:MarR family transcriptional regulator n=1 Tax=Xylophilus ampelinus TaxID=54067 RepID=A0A318SQF5_9BURK|nr:MarR family transcriptional regulator [Xylophilus ampelinus]MCS4509522.1 MarR family transcriptional regulator [Xylophilus ampelinus]PYE79252.1 MarR family transcriptional regulator [Xylophilus ampelinus]